ncbi:conserved hypothetical protein [Methanococcus vannielii SB]|uniref:DUF7982 domain-containing protein n=1 Tax=Methanococcus vannielii (strain ATCC 35089 / DSM 1224 / JCM 13029 / OCM 148 / SB) TaxID=406327 RepID=A6UNM8_METVS|nr:hypothetical protein [Methanococcus vannielii]ABR54100.1 conserved hypothetical protein [Methanococcus vannielii SB]
MAGTLVSIIGMATIYYGISNSVMSFINLGISGIFIGIIINALIPSNSIDYSIHQSLTFENEGLLKKIFLNLKLSKKAVYIPPYDNLEYGGIFIPSSDNFTLNMSAFDENSLFISNQVAFSEMGVLITPPTGLSILKKFEENLSSSLSGIDLNTLMSLVSSSLSSMDLLADFEYEEIESENKICLKIYKTKNIENFNEFFYLSPIISSIFLAISKASGKAVYIENFSETNDYFEFLVSKIV